MKNNDGNAAFLNTLHLLKQLPLQGRAEAMDFLIEAAVVRIKKEKIKVNENDWLVATYKMPLTSVEITSRIKAKDIVKNSIKDKKSIVIAYSLYSILHKDKFKVMGLHYNKTKSN